MIRKLLVIGVVITALTSSCFYETCIECEIYDEYGYYVKNYGEYCSEDGYDLDVYQDDADFHAYEFYGGWAECTRY